MFLKFTTGITLISYSVNNMLYKTFLCLKSLFQIQQKKIIKLFIFLCLLCVNNISVAQQPNIIFILGDDIGYQTLNVNGGKTFSTPNLDSLAHNGINFTQCHGTPSCSPSRIMLLTGKQNFRNYSEWGSLDTSQKTIANYLQDAGYKTACFGKWQLDGGETSVKKFGFDDYCIFCPFQGKPPRYKNPEIYANGEILPDSITSGKYGPDIFFDSLSSFMEKNSSDPFFIYYSMVLAHDPFQPTPDDSDYATWGSTTESDTSYYSSMISYMDKKVGQVVQKVNDLGIANNTIIIFLGDNGTPRNISQYVDDDSLIVGGKGTPKESGTHVPLIVYWPGTINPNQINNDLIGFTDFMPTLSSIANIQLPVSDSDGISFAPQIMGDTGTTRKWLFYHYDPRPGTSLLRRWAQTDTYKLYDTSSTSDIRLFYNISKDPDEDNPIPDDSLTAEETVIKQQLADVIDGYVAQGLPLLSMQPSITYIDDSTITVKSEIKMNGGSTVDSSGVVWSINPNPDLTNANSINSGVDFGDFVTKINSLIPGQTYYIKSFASNFAGTAYSDEIKIKAYASPTATEASAIDSNTFTANWDQIPGASGYRLDLSKNPDFAVVKNYTLNEKFDNGNVEPEGWVFNQGIRADTIDFGASTPSIEFYDNKAQVITTLLQGNATQLRFWYKGINTNKKSYLLIEGFDGKNWIEVTKITNLNKNGITRMFNDSTSIPLPPNLKQFRFTYYMKKGTVIIDDISIKYSETTPSFIDGYENLYVDSNSKIITGLKPASNYYYRLRAEEDSITTGNSNVITVTTCKRPDITSLSIINPLCVGGETGSVSVEVSGGIEPILFNWTGSNDFNSDAKEIDSLSQGNYHLTITSNGGCAIDTNVVISDPTPITVAAIADSSIKCAGGTTTITVTANGGTGNYQYTLTDGTNTIGPQDDNHFTVAAGKYSLIVVDDNYCSVTSDSIEINDGNNCNAVSPATIQKSFSNIKKQSIGLEIKIFPNPAPDEFNIKVQSSVEEEIQVIVTNLFGQKISDFRLTRNQSYYFGHKFPAGIYFINVIQGKTSKSFKIIKL